MLHYNNFLSNRFLWTLYVNNQNENGSHIYKKDFARALHIETTSLPITNSPRTGEILTSLFGTGERVTFEQFRSWLLIHKDATILSKWLLFDKGNHVHDLETPTFYQSLAGVTHLEERVSILYVYSFFYEYLAIITKYTINYIQLLNYYYELNNLTSFTLSCYTKFRHS